MRNEAFNQFVKFLRTIRMGWLVPFLLLAKRENPREQLRAITTGVVFPVLAILAFLAIWSICSRQIVTKFGTVPGPAQVKSAWGSLMNENRLEDIKREAHMQRQREGRIKYLDKYSDVLKEMPGGPPKFENLAETTEAVEDASTRFERANELLEVQNKLTIAATEAEAPAEEPQVDEAQVEENGGEDTETKE